MKITIDEVNYIAKLSKLSFSEEEAAQFAQQFENILDHFHTMDQMDLDGVDLHEFAEGAKSVVRADEVAVFEDKKKLFQNVKQMRDTYIQVPKIIE